jgi:hypothetical protein
MKTNVHSVTNGEKPTMASGKTKGVPLTDEKRNEFLTVYSGLAQKNILEKKAAVLPPNATLARIDVPHGRFRSASFGRSITLLVCDNAEEFYVQYGKSTNSEAGIYGPFSLEK